MWHIAGITNTVANAINWFDMDPANIVYTDLLHDLGENDYIQGKYEHQQI